ncbi:MAG TPA: asparaginase domain-containing protein [Terriglobia bacterium]|nr:asparaginase domain-containing protein [Terriglobia bacterium]
MQIKIFTTGGTIDKIYFDKLSEFQVGEPQVGEVLREANVSFEFQVEAILHKDSLDLSQADRQFILEKVLADPHRHILITHGTDTMIETALLLRGLPEKVIVLTGSMSPARFRNTDAVFNIGCAVAAVQLLGEGVYIAINGRVFKPDRLRKNRETLQFEEY